MSGKNLRLLGEEKSPAWQPSLQEIIDELRTELERGETVYSPAELDHLARKLAEYELMLLRMIAP